MTLEELKRREKELRQRYGDELYEKIYVQQSARDTNESGIVPKPGVSDAAMPYNPVQPVTRLPHRDQFKNKADSAFYTEKTNSGIISNKPYSLSDYDNDIKSLENRIAELHKQQYSFMLMGADNKVDTIDKIIKNSQKQLDDMKAGKSVAMGIGTQSSAKDMLRAANSEAETDARRMSGSIGFSRPSVADRIKSISDTRQSQSMAGLNGEYPPEPSPSPVPAPPPVEPGHPDMKSYEEEVGRFWDKHDAWENIYSEQNLNNYNVEKQERADKLKYQPSEEFSSLIKEGLKSAQYSLNAASKLGNNEQVAEYEEIITQLESIERIFTDSNSPNSFKYHDLELGLQAVQSLAKKYQEDILYARNAKMYQEVKGKIDLANNEIIAINRGMNIVGEAHLDDIDELYKNNKMSYGDYEASYKEYYQSVIDRESLIKVESRSLNEDNLTINDGSYYHVMGVLQAFDVPLYSTEKDAVLAFKKEAMPLTLKNNTEYSAILDSIDILDTQTGEVKTYHYYIEVKQGEQNNVVFNAIIGAGGGQDRKLLHTHPVEGYWGRGFSGDPENHGLINKYLFDNNPKKYKGLFGEMGDSSVPGWMGYGGVYVVGSGAEVKLYEGFGEAGIGSGHNTYANTKNELSYVSTIDLY